MRSSGIGLGLSFVGPEPLFVGRLLCLQHTITLTRDHYLYITANVHGRTVLPSGRDIHVMWGIPFPESRVIQSVNMIVPEGCKLGSRASEGLRTAGSGATAWVYARALQPTSFVTLHKLPDLSTPYFRFPFCNMEMVIVLTSDICCDN